MSKNLHLRPANRLLIGLELHIQLAVPEKLFSKSQTRITSANRNTSAHDIGLPGALPVINMSAIEKAVEAVYIFGNEPSSVLTFDRKHYRYPDLPWGYQMTQDRTPISTGGTIFGVSMDRMAIEQDSAKSIRHGDMISLDFHRAGMPLLEMVTQPVMHHPSEAVSFVSRVQQTLQAHRISSAHMHVGALRCDVNISLSGAPCKTEVKNLNSLKSIEQALFLEWKRHKVDPPRENETKGFDARRKKTYLLRTKSSRLEYAFLPDPDVPPLILDPLQLDQWKSQAMEKTRDPLLDMGYAFPLDHMIHQDKDAQAYLYALHKQSIDPEKGMPWFQFLLGRIRQSSLSFSNPLKPSVFASWVQSTSHELPASWVKRNIARVLRGDPVESTPLLDPVSLVSDIQQAYPRDQLSVKPHKVHAFYMGKAMQRAKGNVDPHALSDHLKKVLDQH